MGSKPKAPDMSGVNKALENQQTIIKNQQKQIEKMAARTPYEAPDSLESAQKLKIVDIVCEGPVDTEVSLNSILLDGTPIQNKDGSFNFNGVEIEALPGNPQQGTLRGFEDVSKVINVGAEVKRDQSITRTVIDPLVDRVRVILAVGTLMEVADNGDKNETSVELNIRVGDKDYPVTISGKTTSGYHKDVVFDELPEVPFNITVSRITPDSESTQVMNQTQWAAYVESVDTKFTYPNTVVVGLKIDSAQFGGKIPTRTYLSNWQLMQVPSNYEPRTREYSGIWDGTFKTDWTDNPAWIMYDLITNKRYGLGERVGEYSADKWALYDIAKYCDQIVPDGFGGQEPRFTCNAVISDQRDAKSLLDDVASCFRGVAIWDGKQVTFAIDAKKDPVALFSNANVVDGEFEYSSSGLKTIYTACHVKYNDKENGYKTTTEYVADDEAIARYGLNVKQITAFGATSRGQAARAGKWLIETSIRERQSVTFKTGMQGFAILPWDIIQIADSSYAGIDVAGVIKSVDGRQITVDREIESDNAVFNYVDKGVMRSCQITHIDGDVITLDTQPIGITETMPFSVSKHKVKPRLFRVTGIKEDEGTYTISAIAHDPNKEKVVDSGMDFENRPVEVPPTLYGVQAGKSDDDFKLSWQGLNAESYHIKVYRDGKLFKTFVQDTPELVIKNLPCGNYKAEIRPKGSDGKFGDTIIKTWEISYAINDLTAKPQLFAITLKWVNPQMASGKAYIEIWHSLNNDQERSKQIAKLSYPTDTFNLGNVQLHETHHFWVRLVDGSQNKGEWAYVSGQCSTDTRAIVDSISGKITKSALGQELIEDLQNDINTEVSEAISKIEIPEVDLSAIDAKIAEEKKQRIAGDTAEAQQRLTLISKVNQNKSSIASLAKTVNDANSSTATQITQLTAKVDNSNTTSDSIFFKDAEQFSNDWFANIRCENIRFFASAGIICIGQNKNANDYGWYVYRKKFPMGEYSVYKITYHLSLASGEGRNYFGCEGYDANGNIYNTSGEQSHYSQWYAYSTTEKSGWQKIEMYIIGDNVDASLYPNSKKVAEQVRQISPLFISNYSHKRGETRISSIEIELVSNSAKAQATYTIKTQAIAGGKKAIAGIAVGAMVNERTAESSVIVMADKFGVVKNASDGTVKPMFSVVNNKVAVNGDLIADGTILGKHIRASQTIKAPNIQGGSLNINNRFNVDSYGNVTIQDSSYQQGLKITSEKIEVYDSYGNLRVRIGRL